MSIFKKTKKNIQPTIEYIENKYKIKLNYPFQILDNTIDFNNRFYYELINFGCSDILVGSNHLHKDCLCSGKYGFDRKTGKIIELVKRRCDSCNYYPIVKEYQDSIDIKKNRLKKLKKLNEIIEQ